MGYILREDSENCMRGQLSAGKISMKKVVASVTILRFSVLICEIFCVDTLARTVRRLMRLEKVVM